MGRWLGLLGEAADEAVTLGEGEGAGDFLGIVCAVSGAEKARAAINAPIVNCDLFFISWNLEDRDGPQEWTRNSSFCSIGCYQFGWAMQFRLKTSLKKNECCAKRVMSRDMQN
jgi:hypothetical protein